MSKKWFAEKGREYFKKDYAKRRAERVAYLGGKCQAIISSTTRDVCGCVDGLQIHRRDKTSQIDMSNLHSMVFDEFKKLASELVLYCRKHRPPSRKIPLKDMKHGAFWAAYKAKCRCEKCLQYRVENAAARREERKKKRLEAGLPVGRNSGIRNPRLPKLELRPANCELQGKEKLFAQVRASDDGGAVWLLFPDGRFQHLYDGELSSDRVITELKRAGICQVA